jgi:putative hydrolase of the HAD superfamily
MRYRFVLFDVGDTLVAPRDSYATVYSSVLATMGVVRPVEVFEEALRTSWDEMGRIVPKGVDRYGHFPGGETEYWLRFARRTIEQVAQEPLPSGFAEDALELLSESFRLGESWRLFPEVIPVLGSLKADGIRLAVVSNWDSRLPGLLETLGLAPYFDAVVFSHAVGVEKPHPGIFRSALERIGADAASTLHVGDVPELDLEGARAAGIDAVLVDHHGRHATLHERLEDLRPLPQVAREGLRWGSVPARPSSR